MGKELLFWILMLLWVVLGVVGVRVDVTAPNGRYVTWGGSLILFLLILILGWAQFGAPLK